MSFIIQALHLELGAPPVAPLGIISDCVASFHPDPLRDWSVLLHFTSKLGLRAERLVGPHFVRCLLSQ